MFIVLLITGGGGGNDLLDYLATEAYWKAKGVKAGEVAVRARLKGDASSMIMVVPMFFMGRGF
jgi:hypothetical protein